MLLGMRARATIVAILLAGAASCADDSLNVNCGGPSEISGFSLFVSENPGLKDATYTWKVTADGVTRTRTVTVVNGKGECACSNTANPQDPREALGMAEISIRMEEGGAQLGIFDDPAAEGMTLPSHIAVDITRGSEQIASFTFDPHYRGQQGLCPGVVRSVFFADVIGP
jgi:hypothetical protein